jgi:tartrate dehydrogenase/decarboxylase/D-malate dehydrogenase
MKDYQIGVFAGDGIGPEVVAQAIRVLSAAQEGQDAFRLTMTHVPWGAVYWTETGRLVPEGYLDVLAGFDAILFGAIGDPARVPDHITLEPLIRIRQSFDQYACVRPSRLFPGVRGPLAGKGPEDIDLIVLRENSEGEYVDSGGRFRTGRTDEFALQTAIHTRRGIQRILSFGFELAATRRKRLTMITKSNAQKYGFVLWDEVLEGMQGRYSEVEVDKQHVDAAAMNMVRSPERFDVIVASNLFGDILSEIGGGISGGLGLAPSANINPEREYPSMFEPTHGSAPDIAGQGIANPVGAILSGVMMLEWLDLPDAATAVRRAVEAALAGGAATRDIDGELSTEQMADRVIAHLEHEQ